MLGPLRRPDRVWNRLWDRLWAGGLILWATASCTRVGDRERFEPNPDLLRIARTVPAAGARDVPADADIELCLSGPVDPRTVAETDATIGSGPLIFDSELSVELVPWRDADGEPAVGRQAPWCDGSVLTVDPKADLAAGVRYRVIVDPTPIGWNGEQLDTDAPGWVEDDEGISRFVLEFTVADDDTEPPPPADPPPPVTLTDLFAPGGPFDPARGQCSCHTGADELATARLELTDATIAYAELLSSAELRDTGFPMISSGDPSQSFLVHKLLRDPDGEPLRGVLGDAMPSDAGELSYEDLRLVLQWIADGAQP